MGWRGAPRPNLRLRYSTVPKTDTERMEGAVTFDVASELYLGALCGIGFLAWIARDLTVNIVGHGVAGHGPAD
jgi:hypothetical protein